jgi:predicted transcriptional regulator
MGEDAELVAAIDDEYSRAILAELAREPLSAPELVDSLEASKPTVYRRLSTLEELELVDSQTEPDAEGHHRKVYLMTMDAMHVQVGEAGIDVTVERRATDAVDRFTELMGDLS